jgi:hypothetical protein
MEGPAPGLAARTHAGSLADLPHDILLKIFSKIDLNDKLKAAQACKEWGILLSTAKSVGRHWGVFYRVPWDVPSGYFVSGRKVDHKVADVVWWVT